MIQSQIKLKICGITQARQAIHIASLGAHAIGIIGVSKSPRYLPQKSRDKIFKVLKDSYPRTERVLVVADINDFDLDESLKSDAAPTIIQLHGEESVKRCKALRAMHPQVKFWKALRIRSENDLISAGKYQEIVDALLIDAWDENLLGGTGHRVSLNLLKEKEFKIPWWIAGGISADWIPELLSVITPYGIDASSKLEISPGVKDLEQVEHLIQAIKEYS